MNRDFDIFVKEHLDEIFCQFEKDRALKMLHETPVIKHKAELLTRHHHSVPEIRLQDCAIDSSLSNSHI